MMNLYIASASALPHLEVVERLMVEVRKMTRAHAVHVAKDIGHVIHEQKFHITFDWTVPVREAGLGSPPDEGQRFSAVTNDLSGVRRADLVWLIAPPFESKSTGAWVELGYALALGIPIVTSGDVTRCIFADRAVKKFATHEEVLTWLKELP